MINTKGKKDSSTLDENLKVDTAVQLYFRLWQEIMLRQKDMLTLLIDEKQKYTKGIICEEILRSTLREILPSNLAVAQGFVDSNGEKSKQCDVLVYDRARYAPLLSVNDLVILPIDAVVFVVEVKAELSKRRLKEGLKNIVEVGRLWLDAPEDSRLHPMPKGYIFAFDSPFLKTIANYDFLPCYQGHIEGICVLSKGYLRPLDMQGMHGGKKFQVFPNDALAYFVHSILHDFYHKSIFGKVQRNPYEDYIDMKAGTLIG